MNSAPRLSDVFSFLLRRAMKQGWVLESEPSYYEVTEDGLRSLAGAIVRQYNLSPKGTLHDFSIGVYGTYGGETLPVLIGYMLRMYL
jgi:hypothetical protein